MRKILTTILPALFISFALQSIGYAGEFTDKVTKAFDDDLVALSFNYRYEFVDDDVNTDANANTLKTSFTLAPKVGDWLFLGQVDDVRHIGSDHFNDTRNGQTSYATVVDPEGTGINQLFIRYNGLKNTPITVGRQAIQRANLRYVGGVEWRQNEQTYDAAAISFDNKKLTLYYSYVDMVSRIYGPDSGSPPRDLNSETSLVDASYTFAPWLKVFGYGYFLDFTDTNAYGLSNQTLGLRATGKIGSADAINVDYQAEFGSQEDYGDNPTDYDADYYQLAAQLNVSNYSFLAGYEVLGGDVTAGQGFQTPLATLHKFQGWADKFLSTPVGGIRDANVGATAKLFGATFGVYYHDFESDEGSMDYGQEIDVSALWKIGKYYSILLKGASYDAKDFSTDTNKAWIQLQAAW